MKNIKLYYFTGRPNFGDLLNEYICKNLFDCIITKADTVTCDACFIGSILTPFFTLDTPNSALPELKIWGSGFMHGINVKKRIIRKAKICAVRGKLSKKQLELHKVNVLKNLVLGDPGLLCSKVFTDKVEKEYDWGIIPHYVDRDSPNLQKLKLPNSIILDICESPEIFIPKLLRCKKIISSAMHGLIAADSFCIPNIRMVLSDNIGGGDFKYNDYYSALGIDDHNKLDLRTIKKPITELNFEYNITKAKIEKIQNDLIRSFPYA